MRFRSETISLPEAVFTILRDLIRERTGLCYEADQREQLADKLTSRALERGFDSFLDYYYLLKYGPGAEEEWPRVMDALSVPETYFWREIDQVRALVNVLVPEHVAAHPGAPVRIWCAACASGEEPLTIAMALDEAGWFSRAPIEIRASDASPSAVEKARRGLYRERSFRTLPLSLRTKYFTEETDGARRVAPGLHARVRWEVANLMAPDEAGPLARVPFVFCRNVFIYFSAATIARAVQLFAREMDRPGYLFVGVSESLVRVTADFELEEVAGAFVYVKR
jgi:chemotaxis protein methyltransferase CheR